MLQLEILTGQPGAIIQPKVRLLCLDFGKTRIYFSLNALTNPDATFSGVTDVIKNSAGDSGFLRQWFDKQAQVAVITGEMPEDMESRTSEAMEYGSFFHGLIPGLVAQGMQYDPLHLSAEVNGYLIKRNLLRYNAEEWERKARKHLMSFLQWVEDEGIEVLAPELPVVLDSYDNMQLCGDHVTHHVCRFRMASRIDLVCRDKKGRLLIVDIKTGERSYKGYRGYQYQLGFYRLMLQANYSGDGEICEWETPELYNWSPKDFTGNTPSYHFIQQPDTPFSILAGLADKFWYENGDDFLTRTQMQFSDAVLRPGALPVERKSYYELIQAEILRLQAEGKI